MMQEGGAVKADRKLEQLLPTFTEKLKRTVALPKQKPLLDATEFAVHIYLEIRSSDNSPRQSSEIISPLLK